MFKDILTKGGKSDKENEDCVYLCDDFGFVMDGATGLLKENITNCVSDAKWYVEEFKNFLIKNLKKLLTNDERCCIMNKLSLRDTDEQQTRTLIIKQWNNPENFKNFQHSV